MYNIMDNLLEIFKYSKIDIIVLMYNKKPWFNTLQICKILEYKDSNDTIRKLVNKKYIKKLKDIIDDYTIYPNAQPNTLFINEFGLYSLLLRSNKKKASGFFEWVIEDIIPSVIQKGYYEIETKYKNKIEMYIKLLEEKQLKILALENNQANKHISVKGKYIYIVKSHLDKHLEIDEIDTYKIGKTKKYRIRISNYNTATPNNTYVLYRAKVDDLSAVENCIKALLSKQVYRSRREYYNISLHKAILMIKKCIRLSGSKLISEDKFYKTLMIPHSKGLNGFEYQIHNNIKQETNNQHGGNLDSENILSYKRYKYIYNEFTNMIEKFNSIN